MLKMLKNFPFLFLFVSVLLDIPSALAMNKTRMKPFHCMLVIDTGCFSVQVFMVYQPVILAFSNANIGKSPELHTKYYQNYE